MNVSLRDRRYTFLLVIGAVLAVGFDWPGYLWQGWQRATAEQTLAGMTLLGYLVGLAAYGIYGKFHALQAQIDTLQQQEEHLRRCSQYDLLTGTFNRNAFLEQAQKVRNLAQVGVLMCDIDGLKLINDTLGHHAGDEVIRAAAKILTECSSLVDGVFRMGGDEFLLFLPHVEQAQEVEDLVERIRGAIAAYNQSAVLAPLSLSVGYALPIDRQPTLEALLKLADSRMYQEKKACKEKVRQGLLSILRREC